MLCSFWILKADTNGETELSVITEDGTSSARGSWPRYFCFTDTRYVNKECFAACVGKFSDLWALQHPGLHAYVFGDQLSSHNQVQMTVDALKKGAEALGCEI